MEPTWTEMLEKVKALEKRLDNMERLHKQYRTAVKEATRPVPFKLWFNDYVEDKGTDFLIRQHCARAWTAAEEFYILLGEMWYGRTIEQHREVKRMRGSVWTRLSPSLFPDSEEKS